MSWPFSSKASVFPANVPVRTGKLTKLAPHNIRVARSGSVLNSTRKQANMNRIKAGANYYNATRAGLSNTNALNYASKMNAWTRSKPRSRGQHQNNAAANNYLWEISNPRPQLPGQFRPQEALNYSQALQQQANFNRRYAENRGRARKSRKSRR